MVPHKQAEEAIVSGIMREIDDEREREGEEEEGGGNSHSGLNFKSIFWHGGSAYDAWFNCASNQVIIKKKK